MLLKWIKFYLTGFLFLFFIQLSSAGVSKTYLSKDYIDTIVQNAYYRFVNASAYYSDEVMQQDAINHAKKVVAQLKKQSENDPNKSYILWKASELEGQIFLEEEEVLLKKKYKNQKEENILISKFNTETGKGRPNFMNLFVIQASMAECNSEKANELNNLINQRRKNISREVVYKIERCFESGNYEALKIEFDYLRKNRKYLSVTDEKYVSIENRLRAKQEADDLIANIKIYLEKIQSAVNKNKISEGFRDIEWLKSRINDAGNLVPAAKKTSFSFDIKELNDKLLFKEDSLVKKAMGFVDANELDDAVDFVNMILRRRGVSSDKIAMVNKAIMAKLGTTSNDDLSDKDELLDKEVSTLMKSEGSHQGLSYEALQQKMKVKKDSIARAQMGLPTLEEEKKLAATRNKTAQKEHDGINRTDEEKERINTKLCVEKIYSLIEEKEIRKASSLFQKYKELFIKYLDTEVYTSLEQYVIKVSCGSSDNKKQQEAGKKK